MVKLSVVAVLRLCRPISVLLTGVQGTALLDLNEKKKLEKRRRKGLGKRPSLWHSQGWNAAVGDNCIVAW